MIILCSLFKSCLREEKIFQKYQNIMMLRVSYVKVYSFLVRSRLRSFFGPIFFILYITTCINSFAKEDVITDQSIREAFDKSNDLKQSHTVMSDQKQRLLKIMDAFLKGDTYTIQSSTDEISKAMHTIVTTYPISPEKKAEAWKIMAEIVKQSHAIQEAAEKNDYQKAYEHFTLLSNQCIQCHQAVRGWGKLPEPATEPTSAPATKKK